MRLPTRALPAVGDEVTIVHLGARVPAVIVAVSGPSVQVHDAEGATTTFVLNPTTAHFVREGDPYWGVRLELHTAP
jgi:hypothetical protein